MSPYMIGNWNSTNLKGSLTSEEVCLIWKNDNLTNPVTSESSSDLDVFVRVVMSFFKKLKLTLSEMHTKYKDLWHDDNVKNRITEIFAPRRFSADRKKKFISVLQLSYTITHQQFNLDIEIADYGP